MDAKKLIAKLKESGALNKEEFAFLIKNYNDDILRQYCFDSAYKIKTQNYSNEVYLRGLIEFTNYCKNNCYYCGIRAANKNAERYRLTEEDILNCCENGYKLGFRTFVLQGGEDPWFNDEKVINIITKIKAHYPDCALTLSLGEKSEKAYQRFKAAGADRYLLRHETASESLYNSLHPENMSLQTRKNCLYNLKKLGFQTGTGFMVGLPGQDETHLAEDMIFLTELKPEMVGIGPFLPHKDTPLKNCKAGELNLTLFLIALIRLTLPKALIPATTALGTLSAKGRELAIKAGANVMMPNLSPLGVRKKYMLYDNKICTGDEAAECAVCMAGRIASVGGKVAVKRGDYIGFKTKN